MARQCPKCQFDNASDSKFCKECGTQLGSPKDIPEVTKTIETPFPQFLPGTSLADRYEIISELGKGGMGEVYLAEDTNLKRQVAIKVLPQPFALDKERLARFEREARLLASLNHPNIATIHGLEKSDGQQFLVMELVEGETLAERIKKGPLSVEETLKICHQIAEALEAAHEKGIIHRDLKPANIKVTPEGKVKVLDFGLAKAFETAVSGEAQGVDLSKSPTITLESSRSGVILGTAAYMSPEQARGKPLDKRTDIWSFGCVFFEALTGQQALKGETISDSIAAILKSEPDWKALPEETPYKIRDLLQRSLKKDPNRRLHDIADGRILIEEAQEEGQFFPQVPPEVKIKKTFYRRWGSPATYLIIVVLTAILTWLIFRSFVKLPATAFSPNPTPVVVLMDSPIPNRVYDPETRANRGTNSDDITDTLRDLPIVIHKETTSSTWHREHQVLKQNPDLIVIHRSCFYDDTKLNDPSFSPHLSELTKSKLISFLGYLALGNPNTKFLVYSRSFWRKYIDPEVWRSEAEKRFPSMKGRLIIFPVPGGIEATFRDPKTATDLKRTVISMLDIPVEFEESLSKSRKVSESINSIAVLPFDDLSPQKDQEYFCDGLAESIINALTKVKDLRVPARASSFSFKGKEQDIHEIGDKLNVKTILEGSIQKAGNRVRITVQLVKVADESLLWSEQYNRELNDVFAIQDEITLAIIDNLKVNLFGEEKAKLVKRYTENIEAYNLYLRGLHFSNEHTEPGYRKSIEYFEKAIDLDKTYTLAYVGLANCYMQLCRVFSFPHDEGYPRAKEALMKALELDETLGEAYALLGFIEFISEWDILGPDLDFQRAIELRPGSAYAYSLYTMYLGWIGSHEKSIVIAKRALELDPLTLLNVISLGWAYFYANRYDESIRELKKTLELYPDSLWVHVYLAHNYIMKGMYPEAIVHADKVESMSLAADDYFMLSTVVWNYAKSGRRDKAQEILEKLEGLPGERSLDPMGMATIYAGLGQRDKAFDCLNEGYETRSGQMVYLKIYGRTFLEDLSSDPRYIELLKKMGFE